METEDRCASIYSYYKRCYLFLYTALYLPLIAIQKKPRRFSSTQTPINVPMGSKGSYIQETSISDQVNSIGLISWRLNFLSPIINTCFTLYVKASSQSFLSFLICRLFHPVQFTGGKEWPTRGSWQRKPSRRRIRID